MDMKPEKKRISDKSAGKLPSCRRALSLLAAVGGGGTWELLLAGVLWVVAFICAFLSMGSGDRLALPWRKLGSKQNDYLREQFEKAEADCNELRDAAAQTKDAALRAQLEKMDNIAELQDLKLVGIDVAGIVQDYSSLPSSAEQGQLYAVGSSSPYELYVYNDSS